MWQAKIDRGEEDCEQSESDDEYDDDKEEDYVI